MELTPKARILEQLRLARTAVSGEVLSHQLSMSRVAVWKHVNALRERGYPIAATCAGYALTGEVDLLYPWEFGAREPLVRYFPEIPSTMDEARKLAFAGCPGNTVVVAGRQTRGKGRLDREWESGEGGLFFTLVLRPDLPVLSAFRAMFAASASMARVVEEVCGLPARVKWPNDILVHGKKVCGMLSELHCSGNRVGHVNLGVGLNVNNEPRVENAASLAGLAGRPFLRKRILSAFLDDFLPRVPHLETEDVMGPWRERSDTLGRAVKIASRNEDLFGVARDVDEQGALVVERQDGTMAAITCGDCIHLRPAEQEKST
ncbi:MAG: biotin--[acetyl-CoA-carboxylase] ligase [Deltaproteobacteria bacterium]|nr:biotin--[acetyl-CoA-carboxylase] ligase [Deltaproteobacteria bacterium]